MLIPQSIPDYIFRWLALRFLGAEKTPPVEAGETPMVRPTEPDPQQALPFPAQASDAPLCSKLRMDHDAE